MRKPVVRVIGQSGSDLVPGWLPSLTNVTLIDNDGGEADELEFEFAVEPPFRAPPAEGTRYRLFYGWSEGTLRDGGEFTFQSASLDFDAESGWLMRIVSRSADFVDADKSEDIEHFEETTAGDIFSKLASAAGKQASVHPSIAATSLPYRLRWRQSRIGFGQALADELGAVLKPAAGKWLVLPKGSGETVSGASMPPIVIDFAAVISGGLTSEGRPKFKDVEAGWFDAEAGLAALETAAGLGKVSRVFALHPAASAGEARTLGRAAAADLARATVTGSVTVEGREEAMAGAPLVLAGFGGWNGLDLVAPSISHEFSFDEGGGWLMTVEVGARAKTG